MNIELKFFKPILLIGMTVGLSACQMSLPLARIDDRLTAATGDLVDTRLSIKGFRNAELAESRTGIFMEDQYDPSKIPVLLIHGLISEPDTWSPLVTELKADPRIDDHFQFMYYAYSSATPTVPAAAILKMNLDSAIKDIETSHNISLDRKLIVIGHSLGGVLAKSLVSNTGDTLWDTAFSAPIEEFDLSDKQRNLVGKSFRYKPKKYVNKVVFLATPHRGSKLANRLIGRIGSGLASRPARIESLSSALLEKNLQRLQPEFSDFLVHKSTSIATLRPDSPVTEVLADLPIDPAVEFHSVAGIRNPKKSGDGVVPLQSTFVEGAYCEIGIFSDHNVHQNPMGIEIVRNILLREYRAIDDQIVVNYLETLDLAFIRYRGKNYPVAKTRQH